MAELEVKTFTSIDDLNKNQWNNLVKHTEFSSFFHKYEWLKSIEKGIGKDARHIVVFKNSNPIGFLPNFITKIEKVPFYRLNSTGPGFGGPLVSSNEKESLNLIFDEIKNVCDKNRTLISHQFKVVDLNYIRYGKYLDEKGYNPIPGRCRFIVDLNRDWDTIKENMKKSKRKNLNKALSSDCEIIEEEITKENMEKFHKTYLKAMERVDGDPYPLSFFVELINRLKGRIQLLTAIVDGKDIGKRINILDKEQSSIHAFFVAIESENFKYYPGELLHSYGMKWGIENDYDKYDLGATKADFNSGHFKYKSEFGGQAVPTLMWEKGFSKVKWNLFKIGRYFYKKFQ